MDTKICKLTLIYPAIAEDQIIEVLLEQEPPLPGFTSWAVDGHGHDFTNASMAERVRGRVKNSMLVAVMPRTRLLPLLDIIREEIQVPGLTYWVEPVDGFCRLTEEAEIEIEEPQAA